MGAVFSRTAPSLVPGAPAQPARFHKPAQVRPAGGQRLTARLENKSLMTALKTILISGLAALVMAGSAYPATTVHFSGYTWEVRQAGKGGPGPNDWDPANVTVDTNGWLHLKLTERAGRWYCSEVHTQERLGFGQYEFALAGRVDQLDQNVVLGLFNYPTPDVGPDGTQEIDIEFARWGRAATPIGNFTVWPARTGLKQETKPFPFQLEGDLSTHRFAWSPASIRFQSSAGLGENQGRPLADWRYEPANAADRIARKPMPVHLNLWCCNGRPPVDKKPVELIVRSFKFTPLPPP
jgi:hypothetical protein